MWERENDLSTRRLSGSMSIYSEAVDEFCKNATEFLKSVPLLARSRDAYQHAMKVSADVRSILDKGDETMRTLMTQLEQAVRLHVGELPQEKKKPEAVKLKPEAVKLEPVPAAGENARVLP